MRGLAFERLTPAGKLRRLRDLARSALANYDLVDREPTASWDSLDDQVIQATSAIVRGTVVA